MPRTFTRKPASPALQTNKSFPSEICGAWLFVESTGHTITDYSGNNRHLSGTGGAGAYKFFF